MADVRVQYVNKTTNHHEHITHLGGDAWTWSRAQVVSSIEDRSNTFYTLEGGSRADVAVVNAPGGKYVRTVADKTWTDNLLALPRCVVAAA